MGYTTEFTGIGFWTDRPLQREHIMFLLMFNRTRHLLYKADDILPGPTRSLVETPVGPPDWHILADDLIRPGAEFRHGIVGPQLPSLDNNRTPEGIPGLWCGWTVNSDGNITWDRNDKFYRYIEWLNHLISTYLMPWGYKLNGTMSYKGEDEDDFGRIIVVDNEVTKICLWGGE